MPISISTGRRKDGRGKVSGGVESFSDLRLLAELRQQAEQQDSFSNIIGRSRAMRQLFDRVAFVGIEDHLGLDAVLFESAMKHPPHRHGAATVICGVKDEGGRANFISVGKRAV